MNSSIGVQEYPFQRVVLSEAEVLLKNLSMICINFDFAFIHRRAYLYIQVHNTPTRLSAHSILYRHRHGNSFDAATAGGRIKPLQFTQGCFKFVL